MSVCTGKFKKKKIDDVLCRCAMLLYFLVRCHGIRMRDISLWFIINCGRIIRLDHFLMYYKDNGLEI